MARKAESFKIDEKKKVIILYTNVTNVSPAEKELKEFYLSNGYTPMFEEKKPALTVAEMRKALKADEKALKSFEDAYKEKNGFFKACKVYQAWKKANK